MTIEKKGATKQSAEETDKAIRKFVLDNPVLTRTQSVIDKIDKSKKKGILPIKKNKGGGADMLKVKSDKQKKLKDLPRGLQIDTTTSAYGDSAKGRAVPKFQGGGMCKGAGAAIKGTKFTGVF